MAWTSTQRLARWTEILTVLARYGWGDISGRLWGEQHPPEVERGDVPHLEGGPQQLCETLMSLGPVAIKLGQLLSTRADLIGPDYAQALEALQSETPRDDWEHVTRLIEEEFGEPPQELFAEFETQAFASASIGQVHRALTHQGERVVVKVQHAGIAQLMHMDLAILIEIAQQLERFEEFTRYQPVAIATEFRRMLLRELDFSLEARHLNQFALNFAADHRLHVPTVYDDLSSKKVLTMEYVEGTSLKQLSSLHEHNYDLGALARRGAELYLEMIFEHGLYHADPHPGNLLLLEEDTIGLLDFGMVGRVSQSLRHSFEDILMAYVGEDLSRMADLVLKLGRVPKDIDRVAFTQDFGRIVEEVSVQDMNHIDVGSVLEQCMSVIRKYRVVLPVEVSLIVRVVVMLDGTAQSLDPSFQMGELMAPYSQKILMNRLSPASQMRKMARMGTELNALSEVLPKSLTELAMHMSDGSLDLSVEHRDLINSVHYICVTLSLCTMFLGCCVMLTFSSRHQIVVAGGIGALLSICGALLHIRRKT